MNVICFANPKSGTCLLIVCLLSRKQSHPSLESVGNRFVLCQAKTLKPSEAHAVPCLSFTPYYSLSSQAVVVVIGAQRLAITFDKFTHKEYFA